MRDKNSDSQQFRLFKKTGLFFAFLCVLYLFSYLLIQLLELPIPDETPSFAPMLPAVAVIAALFVLSAFRPPLNWIQPVLLLLMTPLPMIYAQIPIFNLGVFIAAEILLYRLGLFARWKLLKFVLSILYFFLCQAIRGINAGESLFNILIYILFLCLFLFFLLIVYGEQWIIYLKEPKPLLFLSDLGLTKKEIAYLKALLNGKSVKEIAVENKVKESTVRNTLARVYRKFDVPDKSGLKAKCALYSLKE